DEHQVRSTPSDKMVQLGVALLRAHPRTIVRAWRSMSGEQAGAVRQGPPLFQGQGPPPVEPAAWGDVAPRPGKGVGHLDHSRLIRYGGSVTGDDVAVGIAASEAHVRQQGQPLKHRDRVIAKGHEVAEHEVFINAALASDVGKYGVE